MGSYKWAMVHKLNKPDIRSILTNFGFEMEEGDEDYYSAEINSWNPLKAELTKDSEIEFTFHWMGDSTTEIYYDYLIQAGTLIGQLMAAIQNVTDQHKQKAKS